MALKCLLLFPLSAEGLPVYWWWESWFYHYFIKLLNYFHITVFEVGMQLRVHGMSHSNWQHLSLCGSKTNGKTPSHQHLRFCAVWLSPILVVSIQERLTRVPPFIIRHSFSFQQIFRLGILLMMSPLSRVGAEDREDPRSQKERGTGLPSLEAAWLHEASVVGTVGGSQPPAKAAPPDCPHQESLPYPLHLSVWFSPQDHRLFSGISEGLFCLST